MLLKDFVAVHHIGTVVTHRNHIECCSSFEEFYKSAGVYF